MRYFTVLTSASLLIGLSRATAETIQCSTSFGNGICLSVDTIHTCEDGFAVSGGCSLDMKCCIKRTCQTGRGQGMCVDSADKCAQGHSVSEGCPGSKGIRCCIDNIRIDRRSKLPETVRGPSIEVPNDSFHIERRQTVRGLDEKQSSYARTVATIAKSKNLGIDGCIVGTMTVLRETYFKNLGNVQFSDARSASDGLGSDYTSVGIFQQSWERWGPPGLGPEEKTSWLMVPENAASAFFDFMIAYVPDWRKMDKGEACQAVQRSEELIGYKKHETYATEICRAIGGW